MELSAIAGQALILLGGIYGISVPTILIWSIVERQKLVAEYAGARSARDMEKA